MLIRCIEVLFPNQPNNQSISSRKSSRKNKAKRDIRGSVLIRHRYIDI